MKRNLILLVLYLSTVLVFSQQLKLEKASPFTAVKWEHEQPIVQFNTEWYHFEKLEDFTKDEILNFCKKQYGSKWQKRFSEDLVAVLQGLGYQPNKHVSLQLYKDGVSKTFTGIFTLENRQKSLQYNQEITESKLVLTQKMTVAEALEDLKQFEEILVSTSSYAQLATFDYKSAINQLYQTIQNSKTNIVISAFSNELGKIMSEIGDRHSSIKNKLFPKENHSTYNLRLPFGLASINEKIVALNQDVKEETYSYYYPFYPYIKSINGLSIETLINSYNFRDKKAPKQAKISNGANAIQKYGELLFKNNISCPDSVTIVFSDGITEKTESFSLTTEKKGYKSKLFQESYNTAKRMQTDKNLEELSKILENNIGYISIPRMYSYKSIKGLEYFIENTLKNFSNTKALIIDVRNNPGGTRDILQTFASYIIQTADAPWVANVAYLRTDEALNWDEESMSGRYLYAYNSEKFTDQDRTAIDEFHKGFQLQNSFDVSKFSSPFYMILHPGKESYTKPVYILVNEKSFSAATVFTSAFKSLPNVKIVGVTTDGSSGNSRRLYLKNSNIRVRVSTMLSFQRNGKTLDGNGTTPDIIITEDENQVLIGVDNQLNSLVEMINKTN